jgi:hypothetical protein
MEGSIIQKHSNDFLIFLLEQLQDEELEKPIAEMDTDLVLECSHLILKLRGIDYTPLTKDEINERVKKIFKQS